MMKSSFVLIIAAMAMLTLNSDAADPATGWMAYAVGDISSTGASRITKLEMYWKVGAEPKHSSAFFSPWYDEDTFLLFDF